MQLAVIWGLAASCCFAVPRNVGEPGQMLTSPAVHPGEATSGRLIGAAIECSSLRRFK